jgi:hypothetical protein
MEIEFGNVGAGCGVDGYVVGDSRPTGHLLGELAYLCNE